MKIVILDYYYPKFLQMHYAKNPRQMERSFEEERQALMKERFGTFDSYSHHLKQLGHEAEEFVTNDERTQLKWAKENGVKVGAWPTVIANGANYLFGFDWRFEIVREQLKRIRPDVTYIQEQNLFTDKMISELKEFTHLIACQIASPLMSRRNYRTMDLVVTSFPHFVPLFRDRGIHAEYLQLGFDRRIFTEIGNIPKQFDITFVGGVSKAHKSRWKLLEKVCKKFPLAWFGYGAESLPAHSELKRAWKGEMWGLEMYRTLAASKATINYHIDVAGDYANNARLFEATGMGACLVTDWKQNLSDFFELDREVLAYRSADELLEKIDYCLRRPQECERIARQGAKKTFNRHAYEITMAKLGSIFDQYLHQQTVAR